MDISKQSTAGTLESSDIMILLDKGEKGIDIELKSSVMYQFGDQIRAVIEKTLLDSGITNARVVATDRGALDCTIRARVLTALYRAAESTDYEWGH
ncbi:MAG: citrate lyase acyl carrier protein [Erysipelotrichaceae bacterium]|nr:citrate lyase acyl carrier protein [Erysipelotrichaceae bacterium]